MRQHGTVKRVVTDKGFGFIRPATGSEDLFFHRTAVANGAFEGLRIGDAVTFDVGNGAKGPRAEDVRVGEPGSCTSDPLEA